MLVAGIVLLILGGLIAYFGRPREQLLFIAGVIIFVIGCALLLFWALSNVDSETEVDLLIGGPLFALLARRGR